MLVILLFNVLSYSVKIRYFLTGLSMLSAKILSIFSYLLYSGAPRRSSSRRALYVSPFPVAAADLFFLVSVSTECALTISSLVLSLITSKFFITSSDLHIGQTSLELSAAAIQFKQNLLLQQGVIAGFVKSS